MFRWLRGGVVVSPDGTTVSFFMSGVRVLLVLLGTGVLAVSVWATGDRIAGAALALLSLAWLGANLRWGTIQGRPLVVFDGHGIHDHRLRADIPWSRITSLDIARTAQALRFLEIETDRELAYGPALTRGVRRRLRAFGWSLVGSTAEGDHVNVALPTTRRQAEKLRRELGRFWKADLPVD